MLEQILLQLGCGEPPISASPFLSEEDGIPYNVWQLTYADRELVLKEAKGCELEIYRRFLGKKCTYAPQLIAAAEYKDKKFLLLEYIPGESMSKSNREMLKLAIDSLIEMQLSYWGSCEIPDFGIEAALEGRYSRGKYLQDPLLEMVYAQFLREFVSVPRTLCHDDLLPFNVIVNKDRAVFIDWECGGILPYPVSICRLIAHGEQRDDSFFLMTDEDKSFALDYYFDKFIRNQGIDRSTYDRTIALFLFYEYCEWVYLGNKYEDADMKRYHRYLDIARKQARMILADQDRAGDFY